LSWLSPLGIARLSNALPQRNVRKVKNGPYGAGNAETSAIDNWWRLSLSLADSFGTECNKKTPA